MRMPPLSSPPLTSQEWLAHYRYLSDPTQKVVFTVVDVETTGGLERSHRVTEVAVIQATLASGILAQTSTLLNPERRIPAWISEFTGITPEMVATAPTGAEVWPDLLPVLGQGILTGHNISFDYGFLRQEYERLGINFGRGQGEQLCTVQLARILLPELPSRSLPHLVQHFGLDVGQSHRAEADTLACWQVAQILLDQVSQIPDERLLAKFQTQWIPLRLAAQLLGSSQSQAKERLVGIPTRTSRQGAFLYQRGQVEQVLNPEGSVGSGLNPDQTS